MIDNISWHGRCSYYKTKCEIQAIKYLKEYKIIYLCDYLSTGKTNTDG